MGLQGPGLLDAVLAAHKNPLSCLFRGLLDDLRERAVLYQQQLGFCSGTATIGDTKCCNASCEGTFLESVISSKLCDLKEAHTSRWGEDVVITIYLRTQTIFKRFCRKF